MSLRRHAWWGLVPLLFLLGAGAMVLLMPPYENPDERGHFNYAVYWAAKIKRDHALAHVAQIAARQEKFQLPLYYLSLATVLWLSGYKGPLRFPPLDPKFLCIPSPPGQGVHRRFLPLTTPEQKATARALYALRWGSLLWGLLAVLLGQALFWELSRGNRPLTLAAAGLWSLNPRWLEAAASVSNDAAATALAALALWLLVRTLRAEQTPGLGRAALLGALCALAAYAKMSAAPLAGVAVLALFLGGRAYGLSWGRCLALAGAAAGAALALLAPWLARNHLLYGDALLLNPDLWARYVGKRQSIMGPWEFFREEFGGFRWSYYAVYGQFGVLMHRAAYRVLDLALALSGLLGLSFYVRTLLRAPDWRERLVQSLAPFALVVGFAAFLKHNSVFFASQGRLIYPTAWAVAYLQAGGLLLLFPRRWQGAAALGLLALLLAWDFYVLRYVLWPAYHYLPW